MGDRPGVPNVCLVLTSAVLDDFPGTNLSQFFGDVCDYVFLLRQGGNKDLQKVPATVCPVGKDEGKNLRSQLTHCQLTLKLTESSF